MVRHFLLVIIFTLVNILSCNAQSSSLLLSAYAQNNNATKSNSVDLDQYSNLLMTPASILKTLTTATALEKLGPNYKFTTKVFQYGSVSDSVLTGNILIQTDGDPCLGSKYFNNDIDAFFKKILISLKNQGIREIQGSIKVKNSYGSIPMPSSRLWEDMGNYYGASPKDFNYKDNTVYLSFKSGSKGSHAEIIKINPSVTGYSFESKVVAANHGKDSAYVYGVDQTNNWWVEGSIPSNRSSFVVKSAMPNPRIVFFNDLYDYLKGNGINVYSNIINSEPNNLHQQEKFLCEHKSPSLGEIIEVTNHKSNNLFADALFLQIGAVQSGYYSWDNSIKIFKEFWVDKIDYDTNFALKDGSGLSPQNRVSALGITQMLQWMISHSNNFEVYKKSLAISGVSGTLKYAFTPALKGKIIGKSGSMEGVISYCGYYKQNSGDLQPFCIIANNFSMSSRKVKNIINSTIQQGLK